MPQSTATSLPRPHLRVPLRGFERFVTIVNGVSMKIVHSMLVEGDVVTLLGLLPNALLNTFNLHPRMRALQVKDEAFMAEIQPPMNINDISSRDLLRVRHFSQQEGGLFTEWEQFAEDECNIGFDRFTQLPFFLVVWVDEASSQARLLLFSDHFMSDGYSGLVVLNCVLEQAALLSTQASIGALNAEEQQLPLRPSLYEMWLSGMTWFKPVMKTVLALFGKAIHRREMHKFQSLLPTRSDQRDFSAPPVTNSTKASFAQGDPGNMQRALSRCKEEKVTVGGAMVSAVLLAFYHAAQGRAEFVRHPPFKLSADLDYNMRRRVRHPAEEDQVGMYMATCELGCLASEGVDVETTRFWDLSRRAKRVIDDNLRHPLTMTATSFALDRWIHSRMDPSFVTAVPIRHSQTSDANVSNIGRYPYAREHVFPRGTQSTNLVVRSLHVYNCIPHLGPSATFFMTAVESFNYAMGSKCEDGAASSLFHAWVAISEGISSIGSEDLLVDVLHRLNLRA